MDRIDHGEDPALGEPQWTDPTYVLGAVLAQIEDLEPVQAIGVLEQALAAKRQPEPDLRAAVISLRTQTPFSSAWNQRAFKLLVDTAERLVTVYDEYDLGNSETGSSGSDDAAALYAILEAGGMPVV